MAGVLYTWVLLFCSGKKIAFRNDYKLTSVLIAQYAGVAQTRVGETYLSLMKMRKHTDVFYMITTDTYAHGQKT